MNTTPSLPDLQLKVAALLPVHILIGSWTHKDRTHRFAWKDTEKFVLDREWLYVCWLMEESFDSSERRRYASWLTLGKDCSYQDYTTNDIDFKNCHMSLEQRLLAICRVKGVL